ncbi:MAG: hypothetical protein K6B64_02835, partial [Acholeplasmatales bacterium]|nr:hypothetical protein [Acholeplasmatales bacterium]
NYSHQYLNEFDKKFIETKDKNVLIEANNKLAEMAKKEATDCLGKVLYQAELSMKCGYSRSDN